jgi:hypothetical protein
MRHSSLPDHPEFVDVQQRRRASENPRSDRQNLSARLCQDSGAADRLRFSEAQQNVMIESSQVISAIPSSPK